MVGKFFSKVFGSRNDRVIKKLQKQVSLINELEGEYEKLDDAALKSKTIEFKQRLDDGQTLDDILVEAFAVVREAGKRIMEMRHAVDWRYGIERRKNCRNENRRG